MKKIILAITIILLLAGCAPAPTLELTPTLEPTLANTPEPTPTNTPEPTATDIPTLDDVYSDFIAKYNELFVELLEKQGETDKIIPIDFYFLEEEGSQSLVANVGAVT